MSNYTLIDQWAKPANEFEDKYCCVKGTTMLTYKS